MKSRNKWINGRIRRHGPSPHNRARAAFRKRYRYLWGKALGLDHELLTDWPSILGAVGEQLKIPAIQTKELATHWLEAMQP